MLVSLVKIGNSRVIRIPKSLLDQCKITKFVNLQIEDGRILLSPAEKRPRRGWEDAADRAHKSGDDELLFPDVFTTDTDVEW